MLMEGPPGPYVRRPARRTWAGHRGCRGGCRPFWASSEGAVEDRLAPPVLLESDVGECRGWRRLACRQRAARMYEVRSTSILPLSPAPPNPAVLHRALLLAPTAGIGRRSLLPNPRTSLQYLRNPPGPHTQLPPTYLVFSQINPEAVRLLTLDPSGQWQAEAWNHGVGAQRCTRIDFAGLCQSVAFSLHDHRQFAMAADNAPEFWLFGYGYARLFLTHPVC